jgi:hypothetical protein
VDRGAHSPPLFSSLALSDGPLTLHELETRTVAPHRLILASCQSGADVSYVGDEVLGFVNAVLAPRHGRLPRSMSVTIPVSVELPDLRTDIPPRCISTQIPELHHL